MRFILHVTTPRQLPDGQQENPAGVAFMLAKILSSGLPDCQRGEVNVRVEEVKDPAESDLTVTYNFPARRDS